MLNVVQAARLRAHGFDRTVPLPQIVVSVRAQQTILRPHQQGRQQRENPRASTRLRQTSQLSYSDAAKNMSHSQVTQEVVVPPIIFGPQPYLATTFSPSAVEYLKTCWLNLCTAAQRGQRELDVVGKYNIDHVYPVRSDQPSHGFKSPIQTLKDARKKLQTYVIAAQEEAELFESKGTKINNEQMLEVLRDIFHNDVALCTALLGAFMEHQIHIPLLKSPEDTVKVLSSKAAPVAVGVWALFSMSRRDLYQLLASSESNALIVEIKEYIEGVLSEHHPQQNEDQMYAGKLQFLLSSVLDTVSCSRQYVSYSLEHQLYQLCENLKFPKAIQLQKLIAQWDRYFANDALSLIAKSHRPLVARWLKWTMLIHDLREVLAQYTCVGVIGLVNSGKSQLVKELFKIEVSIHKCRNLIGRGREVSGVPCIHSQNRSPPLERLHVPLAQPHRFAHYTLMCGCWITICLGTSNKYVTGTLPLEGFAPL